MHELLDTKNNKEWSKKNIKLPISYNQKELEGIIQDKEFIEVYQDFNLQYMKECILEGRETHKDMRQSVRDYQKALT